MGRTKRKANGNHLTAEELLNQSRQNTRTHEEEDISIMNSTHIATTTTFPAYITQLLPIFSAKEGENVEDFFVKIENIFSLVPNLGSEIKGVLLKSKLQDAAADFILHDPQVRQVNSYEIIKETLIQRYTKLKPKLTVQKDFAEITQNPKMSVQDLAQEIRVKAVNLLGNTEKSPITDKLLDNLMCVKFLEAVREDIKLELLKKKVDTFDQALKEAILLENIFDNYAVKQVQEEKVQSIDDLLGQLEIRKISQDISDLKQNLTQQRETQNEIKCQICARTNHVATDCFFRNTNVNTQRVNNQTRGHNMRGRRPNRAYFRGRTNSRPWRGHGTNYRNAALNY